MKILEFLMSWVLATLMIVTRGVLAVNFNIATNGTGNTFTPDRVSGVVAGDTVTFNFGGVAHSATQGSFETPCAPLAGGFNSGS